MSNNLSRVTRGGNYATGKAGLAIHGTTASHLLTAAGNTLVFDGIQYTKAAVADITPTAAALQGLLTTCLYLVCCTSGGTLSFEKGTEVLTADVTSGKERLTWPRPTASTVPIAAFKIVTSGAATFTLGTTDFDATGVADTYYDLAGRVPEKAP